MQREQVFYQESGDMFWLNIRSLCLMNIFPVRSRQNRLPVEFTDDYLHTHSGYNPLTTLWTYPENCSWPARTAVSENHRCWSVDSIPLTEGRQRTQSQWLESRSLPCIPSCIFSFHELEYLRMTKCVLRTPTAIGSFSKLTHLFLSKHTIEPSFLRMPQLLLFSMKNCTGIRLLHVFAPLLQNLALSDNDDLRLDYYITCKDLAYTYVALSNAIQQCRQYGFLKVSCLLIHWCG